MSSQTWEPERKKAGKVGKGESWLYGERFLRHVPSVLQKALTPERLPALIKTPVWRTTNQYARVRVWALPHG